MALPISSSSAPCCLRPCSVFCSGGSIASGCCNWVPPVVAGSGYHVSCVALAAYTLALGHEGEGFNLIRRIGVVLYFSLTYIAQLLISSALKDHPSWHQGGKRLLWLSAVTLAVGFLSVILSAAMPDLYSQIDDAFEWVLALLINLHALWVALLWRQSSFRVAKA